MDGPIKTPSSRPIRILTRMRSAPGRPPAFGRRADTLHQRSTATGAAGRRHRTSPWEQELDLDTQLPLGRAVRAHHVAVDPGLHVQQHLAQAYDLAHVDPEWHGPPTVLVSLPVPRRAELSVLRRALGHHDAIHIEEL